MNDKDHRPDPASAAASNTADDRDLRIQTLSDELVRLYERQNAARDEKTQALQEADLSKGPEEYERMRKRLVEPDRTIAAIGAEIGRTMARMREIQAEAPAFDAVRTDPGALLRAEILALSRKLIQIADEQAAAVADWNANPTPEHRTAFETRLARLHAEFDELLTKRHTLLQQQQAG